MDTWRSAIREFVQGTLGCGCPEPVFERIEQAPIEWAGVRGLRITIGGRLLVAVFESDDPGMVAGNLALWVAEGRRVRDAEGLNRLRIVVVGERSEEMEPSVMPAFDRSADRDERVHLHFVHRGLCPWRIAA
jgi:hypothetical protein